MAARLSALASWAARSRSEPLGEAAISLSSSAIASLCLFCLARSLVRSTAARSAPLGILASSAMAVSAAGKSPEANWIRARQARAPSVWRLLGYARTNLVSLSLASLIRSGSTAARSVKTSASRNKAA